MKKLISLFLLIVMSFSIAHALVLDTHADEHCSIGEYVAEFSEPIEHDHEHQGDSCETHFMFHLSFLIPNSFLLLEIKQEKRLPIFNTFLNSTFYINNTFRPPIA